MMDFVYKKGRDVMDYNKATVSQQEVSIFQGGDWDKTKQPGTGSEEF